MRQSEQLFERLRDAWRHAGIAFNAGIDEASIEALEHERNLVSPASFKDYLRTVNGMTDGETDDNFIHILSPLRRWSLRVGPKAGSSAGKRRLGFSRTQLSPHPGNYRACPVDGAIFLADPRFVRRADCRGLYSIVASNIKAAFAGAFAPFRRRNERKEDLIGRSWSGHTAGST
jgi:hypothetical protein